MIKKIIVSFLFCLVAVKLVSGREYTYEFGVKTGETIYSTSGFIDLLSWNTVVNLPVFKDKAITYAKVVVNALAPPKVEYDYNANKVTINYSWIQIPASTYTVLIKGILKDKSDQGD